MALKLKSIILYVLLLPVQIVLSMESLISSNFINYDFSRVLQHKLYQSHLCHAALMICFWRWWNILGPWNNLVLKKIKIRFCWKSWMIQKYLITPFFYTDQIYLYMNYHKLSTYYTKMVVRSTYFLQILISQTLWFLFGKMMYQLKKWIFWKRKKRTKKVLFFRKGLYREKIKESL